jgi:hypothetical protein
VVAGVVIAERGSGGGGAPGSDACVAVAAEVTDADAVSAARNAGAVEAFREEAFLEDGDEEAR